MHAQPSSGARCLIFGQTLRLLPYFISVQTGKALERLRGYAASPEPSVVACVISTIISWAGSFDEGILCFYGETMEFIPKSSSNTPSLICFTVILMDGWVRVLRPFNSISVISRRWKGEHERLCAMKRRLGLGRISPPAGFELRPREPKSGALTVRPRGRFTVILSSELQKN